MENKDKELNKDAQKTGSLPRSPVDDKDESLLVSHMQLSSFSHRCISNRHHLVFYVVLL